MTYTSNKTITLPNAANENLKLQDKAEEEIIKRVFGTNHGEVSKANDVISYIGLTAKLNGISQDETVKSTLQCLKNFSRGRGASINGTVGERWGLEATRMLTIDHTTITNLEFDWDDCHNEIDQIVLTASAIVVIEVKNYSKAVTIDEFGVIKYAKGGPLHYNVGERSRAKQHALCSLLSEKCNAPINSDQIYNVVLFVNDHSEVDDRYQGIKICRRGNICDYIESLQDGGDSFSSADLHEIEACLIQAHSPYQVQTDRYDEVISSVDAAMDVMSAAGLHITHHASENSQKQKTKSWKTVLGTAGTALGATALGALSAVMFGKFKPKFI